MEVLEEGPPGGKGGAVRADWDPLEVGGGVNERNKAGRRTREIGRAHV